MVTVLSKNEGGSIGNGGSFFLNGFVKFQQLM